MIDRDRLNHSQTTGAISPRPRAKLTSGALSCGPATTPATQRPIGQREVLQLQRLAGNRATTLLVQRRAYSVSKQFPLEPHFSQKKPEDAKNVLLGKLRADYPLSSEDEATAKREQWPADKRDEKRGVEFAERKRQILNRIDEAGSHYGDDENEKMVWVPGAHVAGLSVVHERKRKDTPESDLTKKVTGQKDWIGAHLIKKEWGGEDNLWNVVCWPSTAEKKWGEEFEEPIEVAFANQRRKRLDIDVTVEKEDEAISESDLDPAVNEAVGKLREPDERWINDIKGTAIRGRMTTNRGLERIPTSAVGRSEIGESTMTLTETKFTAAVSDAKGRLVKQIADLSKKSPHPSKPVKDPTAIGGEESQSRTEERATAWDREMRNYRPERFERTNPLVDTSDWEI
jgi:hypothetical protein